MPETTTDADFSHYYPNDPNQWVKVVCPTCGATYYFQRYVLDVCRAVCPDGTVMTRHDVH